MLIENIKENVKDKDYKKKYRKLPKCPLTYSGKGKERLIDVVEDFNEWAALHHVEEDELVSIWKVDILEYPAKRTVAANDERIGKDITALYSVLNTAYPGETKLYEYLNKIKGFKYKPGCSIQQHLQYFNELIIQFNREYLYYQKIIRNGRMPRSPTPQELYTILMRSVRGLTEYYRYIRIEEMRKNPHLEEPETILNHEDLDRLKMTMIHAEKVIYPQDMLRRNKRLVKKEYDGLYTPNKRKYERTFRGRGRNRYGKRGKYKNYGYRTPKDAKDGKPTRFPYPKRGSRNQRYRKNYNRKYDYKRNRSYEYKRKNGPKPKGPCEACGSKEHVSSWCTNRELKRKWIRDNNLCLYCCSKDHKVDNCPKVAEKEKQEAKDKNNDKDNKKEKQHIQRQYDDNSDYVDEYSDYADDEAEEKQPNSQSQRQLTIVKDVKSAEYNGNNNRTERKTKQQIRMKRRKQRTWKLKQKDKLMIKNTLERIDVNYYKMTINEIPEDEIISINVQHGTKDEEFYNYNCLMDTGSTISAITPNMAQELIDSMKIKECEEKSFMVENGGEKDITFNGNYLNCNILIPNTKTTANVKFYIMPHNECSYKIILGFKDMKKLGYKVVLQMQDGDILYKHRGKVNRHEFIEKSADIYDRMKYLPHHYDEYNYFSNQYNGQLNENNYENFDDSWDSDEEENESKDSSDGTPSF